MKSHNGEGSTYYLASRQRWMVAYTDHDGRRKTKVAQPNTERGAQATLRRLLAARDAGESQGRSVTLSAYLGEWLRAKAVAGCRPGTLEAYREKIEAYVLPELGALRLDRITPAHLERLYARLLDTTSSRTQRKLSPTTVSNVHNILRGLLHHARRRRLVPTVATAYVEAPRRNSYEARTLSVAEAQRLLSETRDHRHGPMWAFMLGTGVRFGEATGLVWSHVDLDNATALICQQSTRARDLSRPPKSASGRHPMVRVISPVKTDAGRREVHLPSFVVEALRRQRTIVDAFKTSPSWRPVYPDLVFPSNVGTVLDEGYIYKMWRDELDRIALGALRMHDLRHTKGTLMADEGEDTTTIQRALGHARQSITADLYIGRTSKAQRNAAARYDALLDPSSRQHDD